MPYTTPPNFVAGAILTEADLDTLSDDISFLASPPRCRVYNSAAQSIGTGAFTALTFDSERFDTDAMHSTSANTSRITITTAGTYLVGGHIEWAPNATNTRIITVRVNGATYIAQERINAVSGGFQTRQSVTTLYTFSAADYVELVVYQDSGSSINVQAAGNYSPEFWALHQAVA